MISSVVLAQERVVSGTISDENGDPMPGVNVLVKGTATGTASDADGKFSVSVPGDDAVLVFTFIGYATKEVAVGSRTSIAETLSPDQTALDEVVVTGYGVDKRREIAGAVSIVKAKDLTVTPTGNVEQLLQGRTPGVVVINNGQPGSTSQIRVRGFGSFGGNEPLYVVDGVPVSSVDFLNPDDIETTTVLKDAASASIYGARAASGVVLYTTKKSKRNQKLSVTYDGMFGFTTPGKGQDMMNPQDFADWTWRAQRNTADAAAAAAGTPVDYADHFANFNHPQFGSGLEPVIPDYLMVGSQTGVIGSIDLEAERLNYNIDPRKGSTYQVIRANKAGTDWYDEITRTAPLHRQTLGFMGGSDTYTFYVGLSAQDQAGILLEQDFKRYALRVNSEFDVVKGLRIGENMQFTYRSARNITGDAGGIGAADDENDILSAFRMPSIIPVYDEFGGYAGTVAKGFNNPRNPRAARDGGKDNEVFETALFGNVYVELDVLPGLTARSSIGGRYFSGFGLGYGRWQYENSENNSAFSFNQFQSYGLSWVFSNTLTYTKQINDHNFTVLVGQEALNTGTGWNYGQNGLNPFTWDPEFISMTNVTPNPPTSNKSNGVNFSSYFGRINYTFKDKYIIGGIIRRDGSSRFGANNRYGVFPAVSAAWRISAEPFMQGLTFLSDLKIRGGYGEMGNSNNVPPTNQYTLYGGDQGNSGYDINGSNSSAVIGYYRNRIGNPDGRWETSITSNIGIDALLFDGKLDVIIDLWKKDTKDLLMQVPISAVNGYNAAAPTVNAARMLNKGIDIAVTTKGRAANKIDYEVNLSASWLHNEITELPNNQTYIGSINPGYRGITPIRNMLGQSISSFFGYDVVGLWQSNEEVAQADALDGDATSVFQDGAAQGRFRYRDVDGNGRINSDDRVWLGSPVPDFTGGLNFTLKYSNFDLVAYFYASVGNEVYNVSKWFTDFYPSFQGASISERVKNSWSPENRGATTPIFESASNFSTNTQSTSFYVEDGSYLRLQNVTLGYTLPTATLNRLRMTKLRFFVSANNLFTLTGYEGLDPSVGGAVDTSFGIDLGNYPITRSYTIGVNLGF